MILKLFVALLLSVHCCFGQLRYSTHTQALVNYYGPFAPTLGYGFQTFHGLAIKEKYHIGFVGGFDEYRFGENEDVYHAIPVTVRMQRDFKMRTRSKIFVAIDGGYAFASKADDSPDAIFYNNFNGGTVVELSAGFKFRITDKMFWTAGIGYRNTGFSVDRAYLIWGDVINRESTDYRLNRALVKVGVGF